MSIMSLLLVACQSDDEPFALPQPAVITFGGSTRVSVEWTDGRGTRAEVNTAAPRAGSPAVADTLDDIGVFAYGSKQGSTNVFDNQHVYYKDNEEYLKGDNGDSLFPWKYWNRGNNTGLSRWPYDTGEPNEPQRLWQKMQYRFVAYSPWAADGVNVTESGYDFNTLTWSGIHEYSARDHVVAKEIVEVDNSGGNRKTAEVVTFHMQHLMARIRLFVKMNAGYRTIRRIELDSVTVTTEGKMKDATFTFTYNGAGHKLSNVDWGEHRTGAPVSVRLTHKSGKPYDLPTEYDDEPFSSIYVLPQDGFRGLTLTFNYSVFDSKGVKTRESEITNTIEIKDPTWYLIAGHYYDIKINVAPDFLYVLSDNDQDWDGVVIIKDS